MPAHFRGPLRLKIGDDVYEKASATLYKRLSDGEFIDNDKMAKLAKANQFPGTGGVAGGDFAEVAADFTFVRDNGESVIAEAGTRTDGSSVPSFAQGIYPQLGSALDEASIIHDYLYIARVIHGPGGTRLVDRQEADDIFLEGLETERLLSDFDRKLIYGATRKFGGIPWHRRWGDDGI